MTSPLDRLTDQERRLLILLAQGHTAKTIASAEGLSVNVVNERLRSARRKTGAGSSRELARLVGRQDLVPSDERRPEILGPERPPPSAHGSRPEVARAGAGVRIEWRWVLIPGVLSIAAMAALVSARPLTDERLRPPQPPMARLAPGESGWHLMFSYDHAPAIAYSVPSPDRSGMFRPMVVLSCRAISIDVVVRGFTPAKAWPQPMLTTRIGPAVRRGPPQVTASGDLPALQYSFSIADEVLASLADNQPLVFDFGGHTIKRPAVPAELAAWFTDRCGALVPPDMRRGGTASDRVY